ncbi:hypothetical protein V3C99_006120 [Haemonchus contortus]|uniref:RING-type domain-containing protein n=1 Tax=Haemonchus contortus TaxID=6289 RepID=A0A7I4XS98_HAECO|nr:Protein T24D1.2 [Haemonchus contortus]
MSQVSTDERSDTPDLNPERLEENHRNFAELLDRLDSSTAQIRLLRQLVELRIRALEIAQEAEEVASDYEDTSISTNRTHYESMIRSDAFGQCTICFEEEPYDPVGCIHCLQFIGCRRCVNRWYDVACRLHRDRQCPLCRHEWEEQPEVLDIFDLTLD